MKQYIVFISLALIVVCSILAGCDSLDNSITSNPYGGGKEPLGIRLVTDVPEPSSGYPGDTIVFKAKGLLKWCNPAKDEYQFKFYLGEQAAKIVTATDTTLTVIVPHECSSGITYLVMQNQVFYGPNFPVLGKVSIDANYLLMGKGTNDVIYDYVEKYTNVPNYVLVGAFSNIGGLLHSGISYVDNKGNVAASKSTNFAVSTGLLSSSFIDGDRPYISSVSALKDGRMVISGSFSNYESSSSGKFIGSLTNINNIMILKANAEADTAAYLFSDVDAGKLYGTPRLNGGTASVITRSFVTKDDKIIAVGNISQYISTAYGSSYTSSSQITQAVASAIRMDDTGALDKTYRPVRSGNQYTGAAGGVISDACMDENDGVILVGNFTSFDGVPVHGIVRLDADGNVDKDFLQRIGTGANGNISVVRYNKKLKKMMLTGGFTTFAGQKRQNVAMVNGDGNLDMTFDLKGMEGGSPNYAQLIDKEKVIVSGSFTKYNGVPRSGFLILDMDGTAQQDYNVPGAFNGKLTNVIETETTIGSYGLLLLGDFSRFNGTSVRNIVMLEADFEN